MDLARATADLNAPGKQKVEELLKMAQKVEERTADLKVCRSAAGYYLGKMENGEPTGRYSAEYWKEEADAANALRTGRFNYRDGNEQGRGLGGR
jgi:hypothetical protein